MKTKDKSPESKTAKETSVPAGSGAGIVKKQFLSLPELIFESGARIGPLTIAYETYGKLNSSKDNAVLVCHALTGDSHAAGFYSGDEKPGWWDDMIGPGRAFDTERFFVICSNVIGGCSGSTGPSSIDSLTGRPYGLNFPVLTIKDMVRAQKKLVEHLGVETLLAVAGGSMGGMQVLEWALSYPDSVRAAIPIASCARHSPQQIALGEVGRQAVISDPDWCGGDYYGKSFPAKGLSVARMIGHITYMSDMSMLRKFGRRTARPDKGLKFGPGFEVEGYLKYRGDNFVRRFDANSYLYITRALDLFDPAGAGTLKDAFSRARAAFLVIAFKSDWLYPSYQSLEIVNACRGNGIDVTYCEIDSNYGHDAFLLEVEEETHLIRHFLKKTAGLAGNSQDDIRN